MHKRNVLLLTILALALYSCASGPPPGTIVIAMVIHEVDPEFFRRVAMGDKTEMAKDPDQTQAILDAIKEGVRIEDVRQGRFVRSQCNWGEESASRYYFLVPENVSLVRGDYVELESGIQSWKWHPGTLSKFRRRMEYKTFVIPNCTKQKFRQTVP